MPIVDIMRKILVKSGCKTFEAEVYDNRVADEFMERLPISVHFGKDATGYFSPMDEKLYGRAKKDRSFTAGDIAICNNTSLSVFVEQFAPKKHFVKVGHIANPEILDKIIEMNSGEVIFDFFDEKIPAIA